jgi:carbonic anhydrase
MNLILALLSVCLVVYVRSHFVEDWVRIGFPAKIKVKKEHASVPFDDQCSILEKVRTPYTHELLVIG